MNEIANLPSDLATFAESLRANPRFQKGAHHFIQKYLDTFKTSPLLGRIATNETNSFIVSYIAYLHHFREPADPSSGATPTRVLDFCMERNLVGKRHIMALMTAIRTAGFIQIVENPVDARMKRMEPTEAGMNVFSRFISSNLSSSAYILKDPSALDFVNSSPQAAVAVSAYAMRDYHLKIGLLGHDMRTRFPFLSKRQAYKLLMSAYVEKSDDLIVYSSFGRWGRLFDASRTHMQNIISAAEAEGFLTQLSYGGRQIQVHDKLISFLEHYVSLYLSITYLAAKSAMNETGVISL